MQDNDVEENMINLELTETVLLEDLTIAKPMLMDLSKYGVGIHIDDFGTGYSSLSYLAELPVQTLKIDQSFVAKLTESETNARVVQAVIALGKAMRLEIIAEGVETQDQLAFLKETGCHLGQGIMLSPVLSREDMTRYLQNGHQIPESF